MKWSLLAFSIFFIAILPCVSAVTAPNVTLQYPYDGYISPTAGNLTFTCNMTDDENVYSASLYHDMNGSFTLHDTRRLMGSQNDSYALLVCGFDNSHECMTGETANYSSTSFTTTHMREGVIMETPAWIYFPSAGNIYYEQGTIEMWVRNDFDPYSEEVYFVSSGNDNTNEIQLWNNYGELYFDFYDGGSNRKSARIEISSWSVGEWHHIAAVWDVNNLVGSGHILDLFVDGSNQSALYSGTYSVNGSFSDEMYVGNYYGGTYSTDMLIDDMGVHLRALNATEINDSYYRVISDHSEENVSWTMYNLPDGQYSWNCMVYDNESQSSWYSSNYTLTVDASTAPEVVSVNLSPGTAESVDPGVSIAVTANVTDHSNASHVILMYKSPYAGIYTNDSMDYNNVTGLWENGTISTNQDEGNWSYRFWSNDTLGNAGTTSVYTLPVSKEKSWELVIYNATDDESSTLGAVNGFKGTEQRMGMLWINNTGDYVANFDLTSSLELSYNVTEPFDLAIGESKVVEVNITLPETPSEYLVEINISTTSIPASRLVNGTAVSYIGGPYINETTDITSYPSSMTQSSSANFSARVKNIGNETASNVTLNWTLPSGWSLTYGNVSHMMGDLVPYESVTVTVTAYASSSAAAGAATVTINSTSLNGTAGNDYVTISLTCNDNDGTCGTGCSYLSDGNCETPSTGSSSGGGGGGGVITVNVTDPEISLAVQERPDLTRGYPYELHVNVTNPVDDTNLTGVYLEIDGYSESLVEVTPPTIDTIGAGDTGHFELAVSVPYYMERKEYIVTLTAKAVAGYSGGSKTVQDSASTIFAVHGVLKEDALISIGNAEDSIEEMVSADLASVRVESLIDDAKTAYDNGNFDSAEDIATEIIELKNKAFSLASSIGTLENDIDSVGYYGINVEGSTRMLQLARAAFQRGDYARAETRMTAAVTALQIETSNILPLIILLRDYWQYLIVSIVVLSVLSFFGWKRMKVLSVSRELKGIRDKKEAVKLLVRKNQEEYYKMQSVSKGDYVISMKNYEKRLAGLVAEELRLKRRLSAMKGEGVGGILKGREVLENSMKEVQRSYFEHGKISKSEYEESIKELQKEMAEVEKEMRGLGRSGKRKWAPSFLAVLAMFIILSYPVVSGIVGNVSTDDAQAAIAEAEAVMKDMEAMGFGTERVNTTLENAKLLFSKGDYETALTTARYVTVLKQKAVMADNLLDETELRLYEFYSEGYDTAAAQSAFDEALKEYEGEDYDSAERLLTQSMDLLDETERDTLLSKASEGNVFTPLVRALAGDLLITSLVFVVIFLAGMIVLFVRTSIARKQKIMKLEKKIKDTKTSIENAQHDYFNNRKMSKRNYMTKMEKYKRDLETLMEEMGVEKERFKPLI